MTTTLFDRLGGTNGITKLAHDLVDLHMVNKTISTRFAESDLPALKNAAATFFISGTGGPNVYKGKDLLAAHKGMNIAATEFMAFMDDALSAMGKNDVGQREQEEVLFVFYSMRDQVVLV